MHSRVVEKIKMEEGDKARMYKCPAGKWTIGAGINLEAQEMPQHIRDMWLRHIIDKRHISLRENENIPYPNFDKPFVISDVDLVLLDMSYQMGVSGLLGFKKMLAAIEAGDYQLAADELLDSSYAQQTPNRANRNAELLRGCE